MSSWLLRTPLQLRWELGAVQWTFFRFWNLDLSFCDRFMWSDCLGAKKAKIIWRFVKLFVIGILTQCGVDLFVYNMSRLRIMGILQRVACCYLVAALAEVWQCPCADKSDRPSSFGAGSCRALLADHMTVVKQYASQFVVGILLISLHLGILYGVDVPDFVGGGINGTNVTCGRGVLTPACNAAAHVDRLFFGVEHMYFPSNGGGDGKDVTYQRLPECSSCYPGKCGNFSAGLWPSDKRT